MPKSQKIDVRNILYHYLQRDLQVADPDFFRQVTARLVPRLAIWPSPSIYGRLPLLVPYARRESGIRGNKAKGIPDNWGAPDENGYFRDDNSLVKKVPVPLSVSSTFRPYRAGKIGNGFVAAHIWRSMSAPEGAARHPLTYSFVPNLVWLPSQVAALSDFDGSQVQRLLQRISLDLYRDAARRDEHSGLIEEIWDLLPAPEDHGEPLPSRDELSFFESTEAFFSRRAKMIQGVGSALISGQPQGKVISTRYTEGIPEVAADRRVPLGEFFINYAEAARHP